MVNWKSRAKKWEQEALTANENRVKVAFCLEREKALRRRSDEHVTRLDGKLQRALTALDSAVEFISLHDLPGTAATFRMIANDLRQTRDTAAGAPIALKDEQH